MAPEAQNAPDCGRVIGLKEEMEEEEDELFEINLDSVNEFHPQEYFWGSLVLAATGKALLANCLMPISDLSTAIPVNNSKSCEAVSVVVLSGVQGGDGFTGKLQV